MPTTVHDLLAQYASMARDTREKGLLFERLTKAYLTTDPKWTARYSDVWLWQEWPDRQGKPDTGIDLVAKERYGEGFTAIQAKFYDPSHYLQKSDIDSFFTASGKQPLRPAQSSRPRTNGRSTPMTPSRGSRLRRSALALMIWPSPKSTGHGIR